MVISAAARRARSSDREHVRHQIDEVFHIDPERRDDQRRLAHRADRAAPVPLHRRSRIARPRPATTCSPTSCRREITDDVGPDPRGSPSRRAPTFANLLISAGTETVARLLGWAAVIARRAPRPAGRARRRPLAHPQRGRGAAALRGAVTGAGPLAHPRRRAARHHDAGRLEGAAAHRLGRPRRAQVPRRPIASTSTAASTTTCRSGTASTSASARRWPAWRAASPSRRRSSGARSWTVDLDGAVRLHTSTVRGWVNVPVQAA